MKWRKLPVVIEAEQHLGPEPLAIVTLEGTMMAEPGDYIITGVEGERYPCKPTIFRKTYELADERVSVEHPDTIALRECRENLADWRATFDVREPVEALALLQHTESERDTALAALAELHKHWSEMSEDAGRYFKRVEASEAGLAALQAKVARAVKHLTDSQDWADSPRARACVIAALEALR